jgi:hypothetical protein
MILAKRQRRVIEIGALRGNLSNFPEKLQTAKINVRIYMRYC